MLKVFCFMVIVGGNGERIPLQLDGTVVKEHGDSVYVDFGQNMPIEPEVRWVKENDCTYYGDPAAVYPQHLQWQEEWHRTVENHRTEFAKALAASKKKKRKKK